MKLSLRSSAFWKKAFVWFSVILVATLFIYAAFNKLAIYDTFVQQLKASPATAGYENFLAWFVPELKFCLLYWC